MGTVLSYFAPHSTIWTPGTAYAITFLPMCTPPKSHHASHLPLTTSINGSMGTARSLTVMVLRILFEYISWTSKYCYLYHIVFLRKIVVSNLLLSKRGTFFCGGEGVDKILIQHTFLKKPCPLPPPPAPWHVINDRFLMYYWRLQIHLYTHGSAKSMGSAVSWILDGLLKPIS